MASNYNVCGRDKECTEKEQRGGRERGEPNECCLIHNMWLLCIFNGLSKSFLPHMSLLLELQLEIVCSNESFWRVLQSSPCLPPPPSKPRLHSIYLTKYLLYPQQQQKQQRHQCYQMCQIKSTERQCRVWQDVKEALN